MQIKEEEYAKAVQSVHRSKVDGYLTGAEEDEQMKKLLSKCTREMADGTRLWGNTCQWLGWALIIGPALWDAWSSSPAKASHSLGTIGCVLLLYGVYYCNEADNMSLFAYFKKRLDKMEGPANQTQTT
jgi:hypothetical protein